MKYILPVFLTLSMLPMLGFAEPITNPFTKVNNYQNDIYNTVADTEIYNLCMNLQDFSLKNLGMAYLFKMHNSGIMQDFNPEYANHIRSGTTTSKDDVEKFCDCIANKRYTTYGNYIKRAELCSDLHDNYAAVLTTVAKFIKTDMQNIQKDAVRNNCNYYNAPSVYKAPLSGKDIDIQNNCSNNVQATITCSSVRGDSRCLLTQQIKCSGGKNYTYQSCNRPILENTSDGKLAVKQTTVMCGDINNNTAVITSDTNEYSLDRYDLNCVVKQ